MTLVVVDFIAFFEGLVCIGKISTIKSIWYNGLGYLLIRFVGGKVDFVPVGFLKLTYVITYV